MVIAARSAAAMEESSMRKNICSLLLCLCCFVIWAGAAGAQGTQVMLGPGQELRISLPLEQGKSYEISMYVRTTVPHALATMTLQLVGDNGQVLEERAAQSALDAEGGWTILGFAHVPIPLKSGRWELVVTADQPGVYFWQNLSVLRSYDESRETIAYVVEPKPAPVQPAEDEFEEKQPEFYTGLGVDARHLEVRRGISPRIYSEAGQLIYGGVLAPQEVGQERGGGGYGSELTPELLQRLQISPDDPYVNPLIIKAIGVADAAKTGVYISAEDTERILQAMARYDFFARYAVIFLVN